MDRGALALSRARVSEIFSSLNNVDSSRTPDVNVPCDLGSIKEQDDTVPPSLEGLSTFPLMKKITDVKHEIASHSANDQNLYACSFSNLNAIVADSIELSEEVAFHLQRIHSASRILEVALRNPVIQDSLPLPHHLHRSAVEMIEACSWIIKHRTWSPSDYEVKWENLLLKMEGDIHNLESIARLSAKHVKEIQNLKQELSTVLEHYPKSVQ